MPTFRRFVPYRWLLGFLGAAALLFGVAMLDPYPRQSLFGPTIRGKPWCVWEERVRRHVDREDYEKTFSAKFRKWLGAIPEELDWEAFGGDEEMQPVALVLTESDDAGVRLWALLTINRFYRGKRTVLPHVSRCLHSDADARCRVVAAWIVWCFDMDEDSLGLILDAIRDHDGPAHDLARAAFEEICDDRPALPRISELVGDPDEIVRLDIMSAMRAHGKAGVPILIRGLDDSAREVRNQAAQSLCTIGADAKEAVPALQARLTDRDDFVRQTAKNALIGIDPQRFQQLKAERKIE